jgi:hypothetical protein
MKAGQSEAYTMPEPLALVKFQVGHEPAAEDEGGPGL